MLTKKLKRIELTLVIRFSNFVDFVTGSDLLIIFRT